MTKNPQNEVSQPLKRKENLALVQDSFIGGEKVSIDNWKIEDIDEAFYRHSGNLSVVLRQLIFSEGATVWLLLSFYKINPIPLIAYFLYLILFIFILLDLSQYWYLSYKYGELSDMMVSEKKNSISRRSLKFEYQETFFNAKKIASIISFVVFLIFVILVFCDFFNHT